MFIYNIVSNIQLTGYSSKDWMIFILLAIFPTGAHIIYNMLLNYVNTTTISMTTLGEPVGASLLAICFLNEMVTIIEIIGGSFILGVYLFLRNESKYKKVIPESNDFTNQREV